MYIWQELFAKAPQKAALFLRDHLNITFSAAQRLCDKGRLRQNGKVLKKSELVFGPLELLAYENKPQSLELVFENEDLAVVHKQSGVLTHPNGRNCKYSLCDELWSRWPKASPAHRLDRETSGLLLVGKNAQSVKDLKELFAAGELRREYQAQVRANERLMGLFAGRDCVQISNLMKINESYGELKVRMLHKKIDESRLGLDLAQGFKIAKSEFRLMAHDEKKALLRAKLFTGRQHQIRVQLFALGLPILGEPLYGVDRKISEDILDFNLSKNERIELTGAKRLMLHASRLAFSYKGEDFDFNLAQDFEELEELEEF